LTLPANAKIVTTVQTVAARMFLPAFVFIRFLLQIKVTLLLPASVPDGFQAHYERFPEPAEYPPHVKDAFACCETVR
jgi:hypothetical protein